MNDNPGPNRAGIFRCKYHGYEHSYHRCTCGSQYCPRVWAYCPRCGLDRDQQRVLETRVARAFPSQEGR